MTDKKIDLHAGHHIIRSVLKSVLKIAPAIIAMV